jgi:hypothetical protein
MKIHSLKVISLVFCGMLLTACSSSGVFMDGDVAYATPGKTVNLSFIMASCIKGYWSSNDLKLTLNASDGQVFYEETISHPKDWDDSLDTDDDMPVISVDFKVGIPENITVGSIFTGKLMGTMACPQITGVKTQSIIVAEYDLDRDVELHITTEKEIRSLRTKNFWAILGGAGIFVAILLAVFIVGGIFQNMKPKYRL